MYYSEVVLSSLLQERIREGVCTKLYLAGRVPGKIQGIAGWQCLVAIWWTDVHKVMVAEAKG